MFNEIIDTYKKGKIYKQHLDDDGKTLKEFLDEITLYSKEVSELLVEVNNQNLLIDELEFVPHVSDANYWNDKWKKSTVYYNAPDRRKAMTYVQPKSVPQVDEIALEIIKEYKLVSGKPDDIPIAVLNWVEFQFKKRIFKYVSDTNENWYSPEELLKVKKGDCDDWGILMYYIIREIFSHLSIWSTVKHRLKCVTGNVNSPSTIPSVAGGHFYLLWLADDCEWYTIESTYYRPLAINNYLKKPQKLNPTYGVIWFTFTDYDSWSQHSLSISKKDFKK